jgi:hypothetical protein
MAKVCIFVVAPWQEIKLLLASKYKEKNMSYSQINVLIKAVKDEKIL